ncbi:RidA family protein [Candidatus Microgenomates bacterium]|nr:RidA family protein [Candidatus Microgenomates bacterium]
MYNIPVKTIQTDKAPAAIGPYSQAVVAGGFVFCAAQIGMDPVTGSLAEGLENQVKQVITNIEAVLEAAGSDLTKVVKTTVYLKSINDFAKMNEIYAKFFIGKPARATVEVASLPKGALVEIDVVATL